ncbi:SEPT3_9_12 [Mytilus coruscus]|uniref:SEPT3_9_12 n=1 Tax=Mytilus coruscus TaxID=42192 RepID=A0A6J8ABF1_MYTCO|nr:SEPT3_9_12 [Mytilus coruscus]
MQKTPEDYFQKKMSAMLNRLMGKGTYESFDMRCMVTGQFGVGKSTLVKLLIGDVIPKGRHATDGISLIEGRCGLDVKTRQWILYDPGTYEASDVVYNKVLMTSVDADKSKPTDQLDKPQASGTSPSGSKDDKLVNQDVLLQQSQAMPIASPIDNIRLYLKTPSSSHLIFTSDVIHGASIKKAAETENKIQDD